MNRDRKRVRDEISPELWERLVAAEAAVDEAEHDLGIVHDEVEEATRPPGLGQMLPLPSLERGEYVVELGRRLDPERRHMYMVERCPVAVRHP